MSESDNAVQRFRALIDHHDRPPAGMGAELSALWWTRKGDWHAAHDLISRVHTPLGSWIHAHLHVIEGDLGNAGYWYAKAGRQGPDRPHDLEAEWEQLAAAAGADRLP